MEDKDRYLNSLLSRSSVNSYEDINAVLDATLREQSRPVMPRESFQRPSEYEYSRKDSSYKALEDKIYEILSPRSENSAFTSWLYSPRNKKSDCKLSMSNFPAHINAFLLSRQLVEYTNEFLQLFIYKNSSTLQSGYLLTTPFECFTVRFFDYVSKMDHSSSLRDLFRDIFNEYLIFFGEPQRAPSYSSDPSLAHSKMFFMKMADEFFIFPVLTFDLYSRQNLKSQSMNFRPSTYQIGVDITDHSTYQIYSFQKPTTSKENG